MPLFNNLNTVTVPAGGNIPLANNAIPCTKGCVMHDAGSGIITIRGATNGCRARYHVVFNGNSAIAEGGTVGPASIGLAVNGEVIYPTISTITPAAIGDFFHNTIEYIVDVPCGCCKTISIVNTINPATPTATATPIDVANASLVVERTA